MRTEKERAPNFDIDMATRILITLVHAKICDPFSFSQGLDNVDRHNCYILAAVL